MAGDMLSPRVAGRLRDLLEEVDPQTREMAENLRSWIVDEGDWRMKVTKKSIQAVSPEAGRMARLHVGRRAVQLFTNRLRKRGKEEEAEDLEDRICDAFGLPRRRGRRMIPVENAVEHWSGFSSSVRADYVTALESAIATDEASIEDEDDEDEESE